MGFEQTIYFILKRPFFAKTKYFSQIFANSSFFLREVRDPLPCSWMFVGRNETAWKMELKEMAPTVETA